MTAPIASTTARFLLEEQEITSSGESPAIELGPLAGKPLILTLGILEVLEQQSIEFQVFVSPNADVWPETPILESPQYFYSGSGALVLDGAATADTRFLKLKWTVNRWGRGDAVPRFRLFLFANAG